MCTLILLHRPGADFPVLLAANRDEMLARPWLPPAAHWPDHPGIIGGQDVLAGGTWLAVSTNGMVAGVLNRTGSLGPAAGKSSRGDLPLMALTYPTAQTAAANLAGRDATQWRGFNLVIADTTHAFWLTGSDAGLIAASPLPAGLTMVTALNPNDTANPRIARHLPRFAQTPPPTPPNWGTWPALLADNTGPWDAALNVPQREGFGTASATLLAISATGTIDFRFCPHAPTPAPDPAAPQAFGFTQLSLP